MNSSFARVVICSLFVAVSTACAGGTGPRAEAYTVTFVGQDMDGTPMEGVSLASGSRTLGVTNSKGELSTQLVGVEGAQAEVAVKCPKDYVASNPELRLVLRHFDSVDPEQAARGAVLNVYCRATHQQAALVVRAKGLPAKTPVLVLGKEVARLGDDGTAHVQVALTPNSPFRVTLDTSKVPRVVPQSPVFDFTIHGKDSYFLVDQVFGESAEPTKPKAKTRPKVAKVVPEPHKKPEQLK